MALAPAGKSPANVFQQFTAPQKSPFDLEKLTDKFKYRDTGWSIPEAFLGLLLMAGNADEEIADVELEAIKLIATRSRCIAALPPQEQVRANNAAVEKMSKLDRDQALKEACATLPADMCLPVFAHCVDIVLADGLLDEKENAFLGKLTKALDIDDESARRVMEVLVLKATY